MSAGRDDSNGNGDGGAAPASPGLEELFEHYVEQHVLHGSGPDPAELCRGRPELLEPLMEHIRDYRRIARELAVHDDLEPGTQLLHYRIVEKLGEGGMGQVYVAEDDKLGRRVALKVLAPEMAEDPRRLERFRREARAVAALNHPNIVTVYSVDEDANPREGASGGFPRRATNGTIHFLTMELVDGSTLSHRIPPGGMALKRLFTVAIAAADALAAAHEEGITHRDLKPDNVMVDARGRVKVLDFGLAKRAPAGDSSARTTVALTEDGRVLGTMPYMSPEQLMAEAADARSDIFSLGIILYEMATGKRPFPSRNPAQLISSILRDPPEPVTDLRPDLPRHLGRIVRRCLEKDPERRYQSALDVRNELQDLWREIESGEVTTASAVAAAAARPRRPGAGRRWLPAAVAVAAALVAVAAVTLRPRPSEQPAGPAAATVSPVTAGPVAGRASAATAAGHSLAVLYFQNLNDDPDLAWLSNGLTDLLVTDLSQSPEIEVLSTGRLYQILKDLGALDQPNSFEVIEAVAERGGVEAVVRGGYARAGQVLRIAYTVEDAASGEILKSDHVDGRGEESLFTLVDELSAAVRRSFEVVRSVELPPSVESVTTSSLLAWRYYSQATVMHRQSKRREAVAALEKALDVDPQFALALANLARLHRGLGNVAKAREVTQRAVELAERLPVNQRHTIQGVYYAGRWATLGQAIGAFRAALELYPDRTAPRNNLAEVYTHLERYDESIREYTTLIDGGTSFPGTYTAIANAYAGSGRFETGYRILLDFAQRHPDNWFTQFWLGWLLTESGDLEGALERFRRAAELRPGELFVHYGRWRAQVLRQDWAQAEHEASAILAFDEPFARWRGAVSRARILVYQGRSGEALERFDEAIRAYSEVSAFTALAHCWKAELRLARGEAAEALAETESARELGRDDWPELQGLFLAALAYQRLGRPADAERMQTILQQRAALHENLVEERQLHHLAGRLALARGDAEAAVRALGQAESLLPPEGVEFHWHVYPVHVQIWSALGEAELAAGRPRPARGWFERAVTSGAERLESPIPYVRSLYHLGRIHRQAGEAAEARRTFERFLDLWRQGDLDRPRVEEAIEALQSSSSVSGSGAGPGPLK